MYDAKYWLRKVTSFMEEKKELLQKNKASHAEIMRVRLQEMVDDGREQKAQANSQREEPKARKDVDYLGEGGDAAHCCSKSETTGYAF